MMHRFPSFILKCIACTFASMYWVFVPFLDSNLAMCTFRGLLLLQEVHETDILNGKGKERGTIRKCTSAVCTSRSYRFSRSLADYGFREHESKHRDLWVFWSSPTSRVRAQRVPLNLSFVRQCKLIDLAAELSESVAELSEFSLPKQYSRNSIPPRFPFFMGHFPAWNGPFPQIRLHGPVSLLKIEQPRLPRPLMIKSPRLVLFEAQPGEPFLGIWSFFSFFLAKPALRTPKPALKIPNTST